MIKIPTLKAPGSTTPNKKRDSQEKVKSPSSSSRRSFPFSRRSSDVSQKGVISDVATIGMDWASPSSPAPALPNTTSTNSGSNKRWKAIRYTAPSSTSKDIWKTETLTAHDSFTTTPSHGEVPRKNSGDSSLLSAFEDELYNLGINRDTPKSRAIITSFQSASRQECETISAPSGSASDDKLGGLNLTRPNTVHASSDYLKVTGHQRNASNSSNGSISSAEDQDSDHASHRSSVTSIGSDADSAGVHSSMTGKPILDSAAVPKAVHDTQSQPDLEEIPRLSNLVGMLRPPSTRRIVPSIITTSSGDVQKLQVLPELEELNTIHSSIPPPSDVDLDVLTALQIKKWQQGPDLATTSPFAHLRKPPPPPRSARRPNASLPAIQEPVLPASSTPPARQPSLPPNGVSGHGRKDAGSDLGIITEEEPRRIKTNDAEMVVYTILRSMNDLEDLFGIATANKAFYTVFKHNELELLQLVMRRMSPAACEFRQTRHSQSRNAATINPKASSYYKAYLRDYYVIASIKQMIADRCQSILRSETEEQLSINNPRRCSTIDNALWRIWTFCKIFGCGKEREDDLVTQMDWLRGGKLAHQTFAQSTFTAPDSWYASSALVNASEHFGRGNGGGLTAAELCDMTEMWNCLRMISQDILGETKLAQEFEVFGPVRIPSGVEHNEEAILEEWHSYILTLGLTAVNKIASAETPAEAFQIAYAKRWTIWPSLAFAQGQSNTRSHFLRESINRLSEDLVIEASPLGSQTREILESRRKHRDLELAAKLQSRRASTVYSSSTKSSPRHSIYVEVPNAGQTSLLPSPLFTTHTRRSVDLVDESNIHPAFRSRRNSSITSAISSIHSHEAAALQHPFQVSMLSNDPSTTSSERAICKITDMGFGSEQAKAALRFTDMGDGLRVDRAVEYLLRQAR